MSTSVSVYRFVVSPRQPNDPRSAAYLADAHALGLTAVSGIRCHDLYFVEGDLSPAEIQRLAGELLSDPVTQTVESRRGTEDRQPSFAPPRRSSVVEVALRPGVTDPVAEQIVRAAHEIGIPAVRRASTGLRFEVEGESLSDEILHLLAKRLLANAVIQRYALGEIEPSFPHPAEASGQVEILPVRELDDDGLLALSKQRRAALDLAEMQAIQNYYRTAGRDPSDIEFEMIAQTWSEHCGHKTFKAKIAVDGWQLAGDGTANQQSSTINGLLKTFIRAASEKIAAPWVRSAFVDNAGIIDFDDEFEISFKVETHNHPSAIEPFGGANTGVGGVIRDVLGVSAKPIADTDVLCFGPLDLPVEALPEGVLHPRRIQSGVVAGVQDYGNKIGIPTVNGAILYDEGYTANPLVFCGCVGIAPKGSHPRAARPHDRVIVLGGGTGRDGLRGATFSSMTMDAQTGEVSGASVQIGDPITEKGLIEVILRARDQKLYTAITDCGAGGLSSAVGEMSSQVGADVELKNVRLKYPGLAPWEIWLSEAQERMVVAVPPENVPALQAICDTFDVALTDIGEFTGSGRLIVRYAGRVVLELDNRFLHEGIPQRRLRAAVGEVNRYTGREEDRYTGGGAKYPSDALAERLMTLLSSPNIASKAAVIRIYDHEVQGGTVVKPLTGTLNDGPSDACVLKPIGTRGSRGIVLSNGINPTYGKRDAYRMAWSVIDEAIRNAVAVGADPQRIALLDNFCWGDPLRAETLGSLVEACRGCHDAAIHYGAPFISGKDSLNNEYIGADGQRHAIPPTLLISAIGLIEDVNQAVTMDAKEAGDAVYLVGEFQPVADQPSATVPAPSLNAPATYRALHAAMRAGLVRAGHDLSEGGLAVAAAEMCIGGRLGMALDIGEAHAAVTLFGETNGCLLVEVRAADCAAFEAFFQPAAEGEQAGTNERRPLFQKLGVVTDETALKITAANTTPIHLPVSALVAAWNNAPASQDTPHERSSTAIHHTPSIIKNLKSTLKNPKCLILHATGTNRDHEAAQAIELAGGRPEIVHINQLRRGEKHWRDYQMLVLPGGFSYADALGAGKLLALDLQAYFADEVQEFVAAGKPVIGICNGFQALVKAGILPSPTEDGDGKVGTLTFNTSGHFECRWVTLKPLSQRCIWTRGLTELIYCPVAHGEGNFQLRHAALLSALQCADQIALTYTLPNGAPADGAYPHNPNGSIADIAGICNPAGNVLGLMPHPENHIYPWQHPHRTRCIHGCSGLPLFENGVRYVSE